MCSLSFSIWSLRKICISVRYSLAVWSAERERSKMAHVATIDPHNDAVVKPAMMRLDRKLYETLLKYKANRSTMDQLFEGLKSELGIYTSIAIIRGYELGCSHVNVPPDNIMKHML